MSENRTFRLEKLVRDGIVNDHEREGGKCKFRILTGKELLEASKVKMAEEIEEIIECESPDVNEYGDALAVLLNAARIDGYEFEEVVRAMEDRERAMGGFMQNVYVETVTVPGSSWLSEYYSARPERFPEILEES